MPLLEESWRRTGWDLYIIDGMITGGRRESNFVLFDVAADVLLPCEEDEYLSGVSISRRSTHAMYLSPHF